MRNPKLKSTEIVRDFLGTLSVSSLLEPVAKSVCRYSCFRRQVKLHFLLTVKHLVTPPIISFSLDSGGSHFT